MLRSILAVVVGYVVMTCFVFATFSITFLIMGTEGAFRPASFEPSTAWIIASFILGFIGALVGGYVCATIARGSRAPLILAGLAFVLGVLIAISIINTPHEARIRTGDVGNFEAMQNARQPTWVAILNPFIGAAGILAGAKARRS